MAGAEFGDEIDDEKPLGVTERADSALNWLDGKRADREKPYVPATGRQPVLKVEEPDPPIAPTPSWSTSSSDDNSAYEQVKKGDGFFEYRKRKT
jgi:hypothetical protein